MNPLDDVVVFEVALTGDGLLGEVGFASIARTGASGSPSVFGCAVASVGAPCPCL